MNKLWTGKSIYRSMLLRVMFATLLAVGVFLVIDLTGETIVDGWYSSPAYTRNMDRKYAASLQKYVDEKGVAADDGKALNKWVKKRSLISLQVYRKGTLLYDSSTSVNRTEDPGDLFFSNSIHFSDGDAEVTIEGAYSFALYNFIFFLALIVAFLAFLGAIMSGIRKILNKVHRLRDEVLALESGDLEYEVTETGEDELADLARSINAMRQSLRNQFENERELEEASRSLIREMSHDLRTPLTSIMLYTELLKKKKYQSEEELWEYVGKIDSKARQMKTQTDSLFSYALVGPNEPVQLREMDFKEIFYDQLSVACEYLEQGGFQVEADLADDPGRVWISPDFIPRIFDNVVSNIMKYGDRWEAVIIRTGAEGGYACIIWQNRKNHQDSKEESRGVGVGSIRKMMQKMKGQVVIDDREDNFRVELDFLKVKKE